RWSEGLHQAVEAKEGLAIQPENQTLATTTFQNYFRLYKKLSDNGRAQVYGFLNLNRDTQSQGGVRPEIIDENAATLGVGANY
ncbi:hypothetical protein RFY43_02145, partial [Acinetobacter baumannii]|nr:hypothetical protein [Acinetobacter baumannii]